MTSTGPVWDGTVGTPAATPLPAPPGTTALSDADKQVLDRPETILNLGRTNVTREQVEALLRRPGKEITGLRELFIIEQNGAISRFLPEPEQIVPAPQTR